MTNHLLERYAALGIRLSADNGRLAIDAPDGTLTPGLVDDLRRNKPALLAALTVPEPAPGPPMDSAPIGPGRPAAMAPVQPGLVQPGDGRPELKDPPDDCPEGIGTGRTSATIPAGIRLVPKTVRDNSGPTSIPGRTSATIPAAIDATAGQVDDLGDLLPADGSWDELPSPTPCRTCGGIDCWWGLWGERHCAVCEPAGQRSLLLADRAARLRARAKQ